MNKIVFLLPAATKRPVGGVKVVLEYANRLAADGYDVTLVYAPFSRMMKWDIAHRMVYRLMFLRLKLFCNWRPRWMTTDRCIRQKLVFTHRDYHYPKDAQIVATAVDTAVELNRYRIPQKQKFYFIQGFENWFVTDGYVRETYRLPLQKIVISRWLMQEVERSGSRAVMVPNGFDFKRFHLITPPEQRDPFQIAFMYHADRRKGIDTAFEAFRIVARKHPEVHLAVFSAYEDPGNLPVSATFDRRPDDARFLEIYNTSAIYVAASRTEGWGLTVGEAMQCGCAVACTDNKGYLEMARDGENALISPVGDAAALARNICRLIEDDTLRIRLARNGEKSIHDFDMEKSYLKFKQALA